MSSSASEPPLPIGGYGRQWPADSVDEAWSQPTPPVGGFG